MKRVNEKINFEEFDSFKRLSGSKSSTVLIKLMVGLFILLFLAMFLPWTQNIRSKGFVTTVSPSQRPQGVQSLIEGRIEEWYVVEGNFVSKGDTIVKISEAKQEYFDPDILPNTKGQIDSKSSASNAYSAKADRLKEQISALREGMENKLDQNEVKIQQTILKIQADSLDLVAAYTKADIAQKQLDRMQQMYNDGLKPLTDLEAKRLSQREADAKVLSITNKINAEKNELQALKINRSTIKNEFLDKIMKAESDRMTAFSQMHDADATVNKLQSNYNAYARRQDNYYLLAPVDGLITKAIKGGIGELIKAGDDVVTIVPNLYELAVELYVDPVDMPLLEIGQKLRLQFDGWPAIIFNGWPDMAYGTFGAQIFSIDNDISSNGKYRIMVSQDPEAELWPDEIRVGGGANAIILLKNVSLGYELWRQLNGFPPDYYKKGTQEEIKSKAPLRKFK